MKQDWLWDRNISRQKAKAILSDTGGSNFFPLAAIFLARNNVPKEVFRYLKPLDFVKNWHRIKRQMRKDRWVEPRIDFWQAVYEKLKEKYAKKGLSFVKESTVRLADEFCVSVAQKLRAVRKQKGLTQKSLAKRMGASQQMISRVERGENISLLTLKNIVDKLGARLNLEIK
jgi:DNA-binding XRE family transcriptional regulator